MAERDTTFTADVAESARRTEAARLRIAGVSLGLVGAVAGILHLAHAVSQDLTAWGIVVSVPGAVVMILLLGSWYEWLVHRFVYHGPSRVPILRRVFEIHENGHHWHRFPPNRYVATGPVERIPVYPHDPYATCGSVGSRRLAWLGQYALYLAVAVPFAFVPALVLTQNRVFTASAVVTGLVVCYFFIRVHDVIHYPGNRRIERRRWFKFLDRHHYLHHIDTNANLNFLLPLCDLLFGTLRLVPTAAELQQWPTFEEAKSGVPVTLD